MCKHAKNVWFFSHIKHLHRWDSCCVHRSMRAWTFHSFIQSSFSLVEHKASVISLHRMRSFAAWCASPHDRSIFWSSFTTVLHQVFLVWTDLFLVWFCVAMNRNIPGAQSDPKGTTGSRSSSPWNKLLWLLLSRFLVRKLHMPRSWNQWHYTPQRLSFSQVAYPRGAPIPARGWGGRTLHSPHNAVAVIMSA